MLVVGAGLEFGSLDEFDFPPHAASTDDITSSKESPTKTRFIFFILCLPFFISLFGFVVTAYIIINPILSMHKEPVFGESSTIFGFWANCIKARSQSPVLALKLAL
ncbi:hypothetical protein [Paenibacillus sp. 79R4]|uniref:hypothetical protein n=1 Tax=Paenibacillus sp. 79R4 TaxID=2212847 RepID=UPI0021175351|nr:hypothetical protein [Paenibacillus sp. 79R4]